MHSSVTWQCRKGSRQVGRPGGRGPDTQALRLSLPVNSIMAVLAVCRCFSQSQLILWSGWHCDHIGKEGGRQEGKTIVA